MSDIFRYIFANISDDVRTRYFRYKWSKMGDRKEICVCCQSETLRLIVGSLTSSEVWPVMMSWMTLVTQFVSHNKQSFADPNNWRASLAPDMTSLNTLIPLLLLCSFNSTFRSTSIFSILAAKVCIVITIVRGNCCPVSDERNDNFRLRWNARGYWKSYWTTLAVDWACQQKGYGAELRSGGDHLELSPGINP